LHNLVAYSLNSSTSPFLTCSKYWEDFFEEPVEGSVLDFLIEELELASGVDALL